MNKRLDLVACKDPCSHAHVCRHTERMGRLGIIPYRLLIVSDTAKKMSVYDLVSGVRSPPNYSMGISMHVHTRVYAGSGLV